MPAFKGAGHSKYTARKQEHYSKLLGAHIQYTIGAITKKQDWPPKVYQHYDLNGGAGKYDDNVEGSPLIFIAKLFEVLGKRKSSKTCTVVSNTYEINKEMYDSLVHVICSQPFFDSEEKRNDALDKALSGTLYLKGEYKDVNISLSFINASHNVAKQHQPLEKDTYGLIYSDENGAGLPLEILSYFAKWHTRMDILVHCTATAIKRTRKAFDGKMSFSDIIRQCPKKIWHVRNPYTPHQWTFLYGTNWDAAPVLYNQGFHSISSMEGKELIEKLDKTADELSAKELCGDE